MFSQFSLVLLIVGFILVGEPPADKEITDEDIQKLVAQLVSPNEAPEIRGTYASYVPEYDKAAQKKVSEAWWELRRLAPRSFPICAKQISDKRYALTADSGDLDKNYTVGFLCKDIIVSNIQPDVWDHKEGGTSFRRRPSQPDYIRHFGLFSATKVKAWTDARKDLSLREIQIEVLEWILAEEEKDQKLYTKGDLETVQKELEKLKAGTEPRKPGFPFAK